MPMPTAATDSSRNPSTTSARPSRNASVDSTGVATRSVRTTLPSGSTTPARIFVPPTSIPMVREEDMAGGYHNAPHGARRQAVSRLSERPLGAEASAPHAPAEGQDPAPARAATPAANGLARPSRPPLGRHRVLRLPPLGRGVGAGGLLLVPRRRQGSQQAPPRGRRETALGRRRHAVHEPDD